MALTQQQLAQREGKLTASAVGALMSGNPEKIRDLWRELIGDPDFVRPDLSHIWPVRLGSHTESLNLDWYEERAKYPVSRRGEVVVHPKFDWAACTLDGWDSAYSVPIECKHVGGREPLSKVLARYHPQFHWQMIVTGTKECRASIIEGAKEPRIEAIPFDPAYAAELWARAEWFMQHVNNLTCPV